MRVCLISVEIFAWGKYGGFGRATRLIGRELVQRGIEVCAVVPRRGEQRAEEELDGMRVLSFRPYDIFTAMQQYRLADADIYHSQEPSLGTYLAKRSMPGRKHMVTFRDTRNIADWLTEVRLPTLNRKQVVGNWLYEDTWLTTKAVQNADACFAAAHLLIPKAREKYGLRSDPVFLPTPVVIPPRIDKASRPTACFISRWDRRKRPEIFFELAKSFPQVNFIAAGYSRDRDWDQFLRSKYGHLPNLDLPGFLDQFQGDELTQIMGRSWIMVNTAMRESLPNAFIEAAAHGCAILSAVNPDGFATRFGHHVEDDNFIAGLEELLVDERWRVKAELGYEHVLKEFALENAIGRHLAIYADLAGAHRVN